MLGSAFGRGLEACEVVKASREQLQLDDAGRPRALVQDARPDVVINCAAHTDVEGAEDAPEAAFKVNSLLPGLIAQACRSAGVLLVHFSSTGCYGAAKAEPYTEEDPLDPPTVHHRSKASGEVAVRDSGCEHLILRTGWLFGGAPGAPKNFVWNRLLEARSAPRLTSDPWQFGNPTYVGDVVAQTRVLIEARLRGTYNCTAHGRASRFEYVSEIVAAAGLDCPVEPSEQPFKRRARVSPNEAALNWRLGLLGLDRMPPWREALQAYVRGLTAEPAPPLN
jgi:dTDP-4-dehydrorhamnose reductase